MNDELRIPNPIASRMPGISGIPLPLRYGAAVAAALGVSAGAVAVTTMAGAAGTPITSVSAARSTAPATTGTSGAPKAGHGRRRLRPLVAAEAKALALTPAELRSDLAGGATVQQIATAKGLTESQVGASMAEELKPSLDRAVAAGRLKAAQEQRLLDRLQAGHVPFWSAAPGRLHATGGAGAPASTSA